MPVNNRKITTQIKRVIKIFCVNTSSGYTPALSWQKPCPVYM